MEPSFSDRLGIALAATPPVLALIGAAFDPLWVPAQVLTWLAVVVLITVDAGRYEVARPFWVVAALCVWPLALLGYALDRRAKGGPNQVALVGLGLGVWLVAWGLWF
ncbi:MAG: hypothetical protein KIT72_17055 [Polyangiaceae bacterium]|nr:hypothetical protein [Polyangiaceae bacterium]MCW5792128.1 hypothetical protein [Polyangiaceae bacterium]